MFRVERTGLKDGHKVGTKFTGGSSATDTGSLLMLTTLFLHLSFMSWCEVEGIAPVALRKVLPRMALYAGSMSTMKNVTGISSGPNSNLMSIVPWQGLLVLSYAA